MDASPQRRSDAAAGSARRLRRFAFVAVPVLGIAAAVAALLDGDGAGAILIHYTVRRGDLEISVTERGNLEAQEQTSVMCEVEDIDGDGIRGVPIVWIIPNGSSVKEGDLLVELDSAGLQERLDQQVLDTEAARSLLIQAEVKHENQKTQNETRLAEAKLQVELSLLALQQFEDEDGGTFQIDLQDIELQIQEAQAGKLIEETNLEGVEQLYELGYRSSGELAQARLSALKAERQLATAISRKKELVEYQYRKTKLELEGALASARRSLEQVQRDNDALLAQAKAALDAAKESFSKEDERLKRYRNQLAKCKVYAPREGMVAYATDSDYWRRQEVREGAAMRFRQTILTIPNLRRMQVSTAVHESVLDQIRPGLPVSVRVDAFPGRTYAGSIRSVAVLPDEGSWSSADTKVYRTIVTIDEEVENLKPGMTAVVEIHVDRLRNVLSVPVQAIVQIGKETWCYAGDGGRPERRPIELGRTNLKLVEVRNGLEEGDRVVLNPDALFDESEEKRKADEAEPPPGPSDLDDPRRDPGAPDAGSEEPGERESEGPREALAAPERRPSAGPGEAGHAP